MLHIEANTKLSKVLSPYNLSYERFILCKFRRSKRFQRKTQKSFAFDRANYRDYRKFSFVYRKIVEKFRS